MNILLDTLRPTVIEPGENIKPGKLATIPTVPNPSLSRTKEIDIWIQLILVLTHKIFFSISRRLPFRGEGTITV